MSWEEIRRLASDFQRIQSGASAKKLSDRNCIELIVRLRDAKLIDVVYSTDGKEFVTKDHLRRQVENEVLGCDGRVSLTALQEAIAVEFHYIEETANLMVHEEPDRFLLILGQILTFDYIDGIMRKVGDWLQEDGRLSIGEIAKKFDLPFEFVEQQVRTAVSLGAIEAIVDKDDAHILYTQSHIARQRNILRGALTGACTPQPLSNIVNTFNLQSGLVFQCFDQLVTAGEVKGQLSGGRQIDRAIFIPDIYKKSLTAYATDSYHQSGFIHQGALKKLGWKEAVSGLLSKDILDDSTTVGNCVVSQNLWNTLKDQLLDQVQNNGWVDVVSFLPEQLGSSAVAGTLIEQAIGKGKKAAGFVVVDDVYVYQADLIEKILPLFNEELEEKAVTVGAKLKENKKTVTIVEKDDDDWADDGPKKKKGKGKKKKGAGGDAQNENGAPASGTTTVELFTFDDLVEFLREKWDESCPDEILSDIADKAKPSIDAKFREKVESVFLASNAANKVAMKQAHADFQQHFRGLMQNIYMFDAGCDCFPDGTAEQLRAYLLRTLCTDVVNVVVAYLSGSPLSAKMTPKARDDLISELQPDVKSALAPCVQSLGSKGELVPFLESMEDIGSSHHLATPIKVPDKRTKADLLANHTQQLKDRLSSAEDPAEALLLALLLLFAKVQGAMLHSSGKFVPQISSLILPKLEDEELVETISAAKELVVKKLSSRRFNEDEKLQQALDVIKNSINVM